MTTLEQLIQAPFGTVVTENNSRGCDHWTKTDGGWDCIGYEPDGDYAQWTSNRLLARYPNLVITSVPSGPDSESETIRKDELLEFLTAHGETRVGLGLELVRRFQLQPKKLVATMEFKPGTEETAQQAKERLAGALHGHLGGTVTSIKIIDEEN